MMQNDFLKIKNEQMYTNNPQIYEELEKLAIIKNISLDQNKEIRHIDVQLQKEINHQNQSLSKNPHIFNSDERMLSSESSYLMNNLSQERPQQQLYPNNKKFSNGSFKPYKQKVKVFTQNSSIQQINNNDKGQKKIERQKNAREILAQLEQIHRKRSIERKQESLHRSLNVKTKVVKLNPQMTNEKKEKKRKQAEQKLNVNIQFLERLKLRPKEHIPSFKQFRNGSQNVLKSSKSINLKNIRKMDFLSKDIGSLMHYSTDRKKANNFETLGTNFNDMNTLIQSPLKLPPINSKYCIKPQPYSIYNIYQKNNEIFTNKPSKNNL